MKGTVKFFNRMKGFGFIAGEDGKEYFVHQSALAEGVNLNDNDPVEFDVEEGDRGPKAVNVKKEWSFRIISTSNNYFLFLLFLFLIKNIKN